MRYSYIAKSLEGKEEKGIAEAKDKYQLAGTLKNKGLLLIKAEIAVEKKSLRQIFNAGVFSIFGNVSLTEKLMFVRNLQVMIGAGLPLPKALETLSGQAKNKRFKKALLEIKEKVIKGENLSDALKQHPSIFSELFQNMIKVGEESGTLDQVLKILSRQIEREYELNSKIKGALMYPAVIISAMIGIGILMLIMVVPQLAQTFKELEIDLPLTTRLVIGLGTFLAEKWFVVVFVAIFIFITFGWISKINSIKKSLDSFYLKIPVVSALIRKTNSAYMVRTLGSLIAAGVPLVRSLEIISGTVENFYYKKAILETAEKVKKGEKLSEALKSCGDICPSIVVQMIQVGEETGETSDILGKLADFFEEEVSNATKNLASVIEPILMLIVGGVVGFFAISMVQPMYSMLEAI